MSNEVKGCLRGVIAWLAFGFGMAVVGLIVMARLAGDESIEDLLATLPPAERSALTEVCRAADFEPTGLRPLGVTTDALLRDARNARSVVIRDGHVRVICLSGARFFTPPDWRGFPELEALWLEDGSLNAWPDLSALGRLADVQLSGNPLPSPPAGVLSASVKRLGLARTRVDAIETLTALALDEVDLSGTPLQALPDRVPAQGGWRLRLKGTALTEPPGRHPSLPAGVAVSGPTLPGGVIEGMVSHRDVRVGITGTALTGLTTLNLPTNTTTYHSSGPVVVEGRVSTGAMRVWLMEPDDAFAGPWFQQGKIEGFGLARPVGYVAGEVRAGEAATIRGALVVTGVPPRHQFTLTLEPLPGAKVTGVEIRIRSEARP